MTLLNRPRPWHALAAAALAVAGCDRAVAPDAEAAVLQNGRVGDEVALPFTARFFTDLVMAAPDPRCGDFPHLLNVQEGWGEATHLGRVTVRIEFCFDVTDQLDGALSPGESMPYWDGEGILTAANGDELHIAIAGAVVPSTDPEFDLEFSDPFQITGGTGRFAGASGEGVTSSFVIFPGSPSRTTHVWTGTLVSPR